MGTIPCPNIGVTSLKGNYSTQKNCMGCWECAKNKDNITTTITSGDCYHCTVPTSDGGHGWTPTKKVTCTACGGTGDCSKCAGYGCSTCNSSGYCTTCDGWCEVDESCPKCGGSGSYQTIVKTSCKVCGGDGLVGAYVCERCGDKDDMIPKIDHEYPITCPDCTGTGEIEYTATFYLSVGSGSGRVYFSSNGQTSIQGDAGSYGVVVKPSSGFTFAGWYDADNIKVSGNAADTLPFGSGDNSYYAEFVPNPTAIPNYPVTCRHVDKDTGTKLKETSKTYPSGTEIDASDFKESISGYTFSSSSGTAIVGPNTVVYCYMAEHVNANSLMD